MFGILNCSFYIVPHCAAVVDHRTYDVDLPAFGNKLADKATFLGGVVLLLIGLKILIEGLI